MKIHALLGLSLCVPVLAWAGTNTPVLDAKQEKIEHRIEQGKASGELTPKEAAHLEREQDRLERHEAKAKADGVVTPQERARLNHEANRDMRHVHRAKHNRHHR